MKVKADREESSPYAGKKSTYFSNPDLVVFPFSSRHLEATSFKDNPLHFLKSSVLFLIFAENLFFNS
jgi:hypothetical protein